MFNLKKYGHKDSPITEKDLLRSELEQFYIFKSPHGYEAKIGEETVVADSLNEIKQSIAQGLDELISYIWESWKTISDLSKDIAISDEENTGSLDNLVFLNSVKKTLSLSRIFTDLDFVTELIYLVLDTDIKSVDEDLIQRFNSEYLKIQSIHKVIMSELYRIKLINQFNSVTKMAQISGPWANLDLPMKERVWEWDEMEESYFSNRQESRRQQTRYNPENATKSGYYYVWQDFSTEPYKFTDMREKSPYKSREQLLIP